MRRANISGVRINRRLADVGSIREEDRANSIQGIGEYATGRYEGAVHTGGAGLATTGTDYGFRQNHCHIRTAVGLDSTVWRTEPLGQAGEHNNHLAVVDCTRDDGRALTAEQYPTQAGAPVVDFPFTPGTNLRKTRGSARGYWPTRFARLGDVVHLFAGTGPTEPTLNTPTGTGCLGQT